jgi:hypothetical protein
LVDVNGVEGCSEGAGGGEEEGGGGGAMEAASAAYTDEKHTHTHMRVVWAY